MESIGNRIGRLRRQANMTQEVLAEKLGISSQAISKWENDLSCPDISLLAELARILGGIHGTESQRDAARDMLLRPELA